ncbi:MAG: hypothetical protein OQJ81_00150 [Melioribacteraceae bacterium]|nr:hypothetical protein [Melioribacteraceae bacterium]
MEETRVNIDKKIVEYRKVSRISHILNQFVLHPFLAGISGFTLFFILAIVLDFTVNLFNPDQFLTVDIFTVLIGIAGFILAFGLSFLESTQK